VSPGSYTAICFLQLSPVCSGHTRYRASGDHIWIGALIVLTDASYVIYWNRFYTGRFLHLLSPAAVRSRGERPLR